MKQGSSFAKKQGTLMALACAAAFAAPHAMAQVASPDFGSGKGLTLGVDFLLAISSKGASGATGNASGNGNRSDVRRRMSVDSSSSSITIKGSEKLNDSFLEGWGFGISMDFDGDEYNRRGGTEVGQTVLGVKTSAGNFFLGVMDNPFKQVGSQFVAGTSGFGQGMSQSAVLGNPGFRAGTAKGTFDGDAESTPQQGNITRTMSFYRLNSNSMNWYSPDWSGFRVYAQYVPGDNQVLTGVTCPGSSAGGADTCDRSPRILGGAIGYTNGPLNVGYAYEHHRDSGWGSALAAHSFGINSTAAGDGTSDTSSGHVLGASYQIGDFRLGGFWQRLNYSQNGGTAALTDLSVDAWYVGMRWKSGPHEAAVQYAQAGDYDCAGSGTIATTACRVGTGPTGMKHYGIAYRYTVSKQLKMFASLARTENEAYAAYTGHAGPGNVGLGSTVQSNMAGQSIGIMSVGLSGSF
jgi:hypothetical protein